LFFNYIIKNQSIDKCDISPVNWVYPILTGHIYVLWAIAKKKKRRYLAYRLSKFAQTEKLKTEKSKRNNLNQINYETYMISIKRAN
jgi:hypothetical protein